MKQCPEDGRNHTDDGQDSDDGLEVVVEKLVNGNEDRPIAPVVQEVLQDAIVLPPKVEVRREALEEVERLRVAEGAVDDAPGGAAARRPPGSSAAPPGRGRS